MRFIFFFNLCFENSQQLINCHHLAIMIIIRDNLALVV